MGVGTSDIELLLDLLGPSMCFLVRVEPDDDIGACFSVATRDGETYALACSGDDGCLALKGEEREDAF